MTDKEEINTQGGAVVGGNVKVRQGNFVGRDFVSIGKVTIIRGGLLVTTLGILVIGILSFYTYVISNAILEQRKTIELQHKSPSDYSVELSVVDQAYLTALAVGLRNLSIWQRGADISSITAVEAGDTTVDGISQRTTNTFTNIQNLTGVTITGETIVRDFVVVSDVVVLIYYVHDSPIVITINDNELVSVSGDLSIALLNKQLTDSGIGIEVFDNPGDGGLALNLTYNDIGFKQSVLY